MFGPMSQTRREAKINILRERIALERQALSARIPVQFRVDKELLIARCVREILRLEKTR